MVDTAGNGRLGGDDSTNTLTTFAGKEAGLPPQLEGGNSPTYALLREACEEPKLTLAFVGAAQLNRPGPDPNAWTAGSRKLASRVLFERVLACVADAPAIVLSHPSLRLDEP